MNEIVMAAILLAVFGLFAARTYMVVRELARFFREIRKG